MVGLVVGFVLAIPPGPIGVAVVKQAVEHKFRAGGELALGASLMDGVYALAATFASSTIVSALGDAVTKNRAASLGFQIVCVVVLVVLAVRYLRAVPSSAPDSARIEAAELAQEARARRLGLARPIFVGLLIALTNLASPTFLPSLIFLSGYLHSAGWLPPSAGARFVFALGFATGTFLWFVVLLRVLHGLRAKLTANVTAGMNRFAGGAFILFAAVLAFRVVVAHEWTSVP